MDAHGRRPFYTALSNSMIGVLLLVGGGFGALSDFAGPALVLTVVAALNLASALMAISPSELRLINTCSQKY